MTLVAEGGNGRGRLGGLQRLIQLSRLMTLKNPLIDHAVHIQANYVWARGATFTAPNEQVNDIVQGFLNDRNNLAEFTSHDARVGKEVQVQIEVNLFFVLWTDTETAHVTVRTIPVSAIVADDGIIYNPEDDREVW